MSPLSVSLKRQVPLHSINCKHLTLVFLTLGFTRQDGNIYLLQMAPPSTYCIVLFLRLDIMSRVSTVSGGSGGDHCFKLERA
jgi:hypothetical protein